MIPNTNQLELPLFHTGPEWTPEEEEAMNKLAKQITDVDATLIERGKRYGDFMGHATITQHLKTMLLGHLASRNINMAPDQIEALEMICHKLGRIVNGDPDYADSWVDIAGYAKLVADRLEHGVVR